MTDDVSEIEPELRIQPPRTLRPRWRERVFRWLFIGLAVIGPGLLGYFGWVAQQDWVALHKHGVTTTARVVERIAPVPGKDGHGPSAVYEYSVDGRAHRLSESLDEKDYERMKIGDETSVVYLPEEPDTSATSAKLTKGGETSTAAIAMWIVGGILALIGWPLWMWIEYEWSKWRRLLREGLPVRTTNVLVEHSSTYDVNTSNRVSYWTVLYEFPLDGQIKSGKVSVDSDVALKLQRPGAQATVLYDPLDPRVYQLYPAIATSYKIEPPEAERFQIA